MMNERRRDILKSAGCDERDRIGLPRRAMRSARAFTIIELLVVTAIIILLLSMVIVAVNAATKTAQKSRTIALMDSIKRGLIRFKEDIGYYPPVLGAGTLPAAATVNDQRKLFNLNPAMVDDPAAVLWWWSATTPSEYLLGYGHHYQDGYGRVAGANPTHDWDFESPPLGIRNPGVDGVWGAGTNSICHRMRGTGTCNINGWSGAPNPELTRTELDLGRVFGPYLELKDERLLGAIDTTESTITDAYGNFKVLFPGEVGYNPDNPHVIVDYWSVPIRYYRRPYPPGGLNQSYRAVDRTGDGIVDPVPTLSDWFFLRPYTVKPGTERNTRFADFAGDVTTNAELESGEFALFSCGPDRAVNYHFRVDPFDHPANDLGTDEANKDNIVEVGP